jgi:hypothetical protein
MVGYATEMGKKGNKIQEFKANPRTQATEGRGTNLPSEGEQSYVLKKQPCREVVFWLHKDTVV